MRMGLRGSRATFVAAAVVVLVALPMSTLPLLHDLGSDDRCTSAANLHDVSAHRIGQARMPAHAPHCAICHFWQSEGRFKRSHAPSTLIAFIDIGQVVMAYFAEARPVANAIQPARAPPAA